MVGAISRSSVGKVHTIFFSMIQFTILQFNTDLGNFYAHFLGQPSLCLAPKPPQMMGFIGTALDSSFLAPFVAVVVGNRY